MKTLIRDGYGEQFFADNFSRGAILRIEEQDAGRSTRLYEVKSAADGSHFWCEYHAPEKALVKA